MILKKINHVTRGLCCVVGLLAITGCSNIGENMGKGSDDVVEKIYTLKEESVYEIGDTIDKIVPIPENEKNVSLRYTVNNVRMYSNPTEAGIHEGEIGMVEYEKYALQGIEVKSEDVMHSPVILIDMTITNINEDAPSISTFALVEKNANGEIEAIGLPCYYSLGEEIGSSKYFHFNLLPGQSTDVQVGWHINPDIFDLESVYLTDNLYSNEEFTAYVDLELTGGVQ